MLSTLATMLGAGSLFRAREEQALAAEPMEVLVIKNYDNPIESPVTRAELENKLAAAEPWPSSRARPSIWSERELKEMEEGKERGRISAAKQERRANLKEINKAKSIAGSEAAYHRLCRKHEKLG